MRLTVDTKEDLKLMREIYKRLYIENTIIDLEDVVELLISNQSLRKVNLNIEMSDINKYVSSRTIKKKILKSLVNKGNYER